MHWAEYVATIYPYLVKVAAVHHHRGAGAQGGGRGGHAGIAGAEVVLADARPAACVWGWCEVVVVVVVVVVFVVVGVVVVVVSGGSGGGSGSGSERDKQGAAQ